MAYPPIIAPRRYGRSVGIGAALRPGGDGLHVEPVFKEDRGDLSVGVERHPDVDVAIGAAHLIDVAARTRREIGLDPRPQEDGLVQRSQRPERVGRVGDLRVGKLREHLLGVEFLIDDAGLPRHELLADQFSNRRIRRRRRWRRRGRGMRACPAAAGSADEEEHCG